MTSQREAFVHIAHTLFKDAAEASICARNEGNTHLKTLQTLLSQLSSSSSACVSLSSVVPALAAGHKVLNSYSSSIRVLHKALLEVGTAERKWNGDQDGGASSPARVGGGGGAADDGCLVPDALSILALMDSDDALVKGGGGGSAAAVPSALLAGMSNYLLAIYLCAMARVMLAVKTLKMAPHHTSGTTKTKTTPAVALTRKPVSILSLLLLDSLAPAIQYHHDFEAAPPEVANRICSHRREELSFSIANNHDEGDDGAADAHHDDDDATDCAHDYYAAFKQQCLFLEKKGEKEGGGPSDSMACYLSIEDFLSSGGEDGRAASNVPSAGAVLRLSEAAFINKAVRQARRVIALHNQFTKKKRAVMSVGDAADVNKNGTKPNDAEAVLFDKLKCRLAKLLHQCPTLGGLLHEKEALAMLLEVQRANALDAGALAEVSASILQLQKLLS